jgi:hypothetical protein
MKEMQSPRKTSGKMGSTCEAGTSYTAYKAEGRRSVNVSDKGLVMSRHISEICKVMC